MGEDELTDEIFEIEDRFGRKLIFYLVNGNGYKSRFFEIEGNNLADHDFLITKKTAKKIIKELQEEFKIDGGEIDVK